jgi:hypothetical protein
MRWLALVGTLLFVPLAVPVFLITLITLLIYRRLD